MIYFEENASSKVAETLSNETGVKLEVLNPLESLTNEQIKAGENYISVMEKSESFKRKYQLSFRMEVVRCVISKYLI